MSESKSTQLVMPAQQILHLCNFTLKVLFFAYMDKLYTYQCKSTKVVVLLGLKRPEIYIKKLRRQTATSQECKYIFYKITIKNIGNEW